MGLFFTKHLETHSIPDRLLVHMVTGGAELYRQQPHHGARRADQNAAADRTVHRPRPRPAVYLLHLWDSWLLHGVLGGLPQRYPLHHAGAGPGEASTSSTANCTIYGRIFGTISY